MGASPSNLVDAVVQKDFAKIMKIVTSSDSDYLTKEEKRLSQKGGQTHA